MTQIIIVHTERLHHWCHSVVTYPIFTFLFLFCSVQNHTIIYMVLRACFSQIIFLKRKTISNPIFTLPIYLHFSFDLLHLYCLLLLSVGIAPHCFMPCVTSDICIFDSYSHRLKCFFFCFYSFLLSLITIAT